MIETLLTARLKTKTPNVYPNVAPADYKTPCVVYQRLDTESIRELGDDAQEEGYVTFQLSISSTVFGEAMTLAQTIRRDLKAWIHPDIVAVSWLNEHPMVDNTTDVTLHRILLFFKFYTSDL